MEEMKKAGTTVYLRASVEDLAVRIEKSSNIRPLVQGRTGEELRRLIRTSLEQRESFYNQADVVWDVQAMETEKDVWQIAASLVDKLRPHV
jgi:shikimate kinase